jgi:hypothetical protein
VLRGDDPTIFSQTNNGTGVDIIEHVVAAWKNDA